MAVVEDIELRVTVNGTLAQRGLDAVREAAARMGGGLNQVVGSIDGMKKSAQELQQKLAPTAAAISGVSSALGQAGGEAGKVVAGIGQMAAAFGAGGPWAVAIVGATMLVDEYLAAQKEMEQNAEIARRAFLNFGDSLRNNTARDTALLTQKLKDAREAIENFGKSAAEVDIKIAKAAIATTEQRIKGADEVIARAQQRAERQKAELNDLALLERDAKATGTTIRRQVIDRMALLADEVTIINNATAARERLTVELRTQQDTTRGLIAAQREANALGGDGAGGAAGRTGGVKAAATGDIQGMLAKAYADRLSLLAEARKQIESERAAVVAEQSAIRAEAIQNELDLEEKAINWLAQKREEAAQHAIEIKRKEAEETTQITLGVVSVATSAFQQLTADMITGEEHKAERFAALIMQQAGQALIASGTKLAGEAVVSGLTPGLQPLAAAQGAGALALIGSGIALGGAATGIMHVAEGGQIGKALPEKSTSDKGGDMAARARPTRPGAAGPGGTNLTIVYGGLSGPSADDGARALKKGMKRASVRGMA